MTLAEREEIIRQNSIQMNINEDMGWDDDESSFKNGGYTISFASANDQIGIIIKKMLIDVFKNNTYKNIHFNYKLVGLDQIDEVLDLADSKKTFNLINLKSFLTKNLKE